MNRTAGSRENRKENARNRMRVWLHGNRVKKLQKLDRIRYLLEKVNSCS